VLSTPGGKAVELCRELPNDLAEALRECAINSLGLARSVSVVDSPDGTVVEYRGVSTPDLYNKLLVKPALGSALASITAAIAAEVWGRPVEIIEETAKGKRLTVLIR
jgi:hypothetical protein